MKGDGLSPKRTKSKGSGRRTVSAHVGSDPRIEAQAPGSNTGQRSGARVEHSATPEDCLVIRIEHATSFTMNPSTDLFLSRFHPMDPQPRVILQADNEANVVKVWYGRIGQGVCIGYLDLPRVQSVVLAGMCSDFGLRAVVDHRFLTATLTCSEMGLLKRMLDVASAADAYGCDSHE